MFCRESPYKLKKKSPLSIAHGRSVLLRGDKASELDAEIRGAGLSTMILYVVGAAISMLIVLTRNSRACEEFVAVSAAVTMPSL